MSPDDLVAEGWPWHLAKATCDSWPCVAMVAGLGKIAFTHARTDALGWVCLLGIRDPHWKTGVPVPAELDGLPLGRGLAVRLEDIRWVVDWGDEP